MDPSERSVTQAEQAAKTSGEGQVRICDPSSQPCHIATALRVTGGKWKLMIIWFLYQEGTKRFSELRRCLPGVSEKVLTQQLRELETDRLVHREIYAEVPPRVEYSLTAHGRSFGPVLVALYDWGRAYDSADDGADVRPA